MKAVGRVKADRFWSISILDTIIAYAVIFAAAAFEILAFLYYLYRGRYLRSALFRFASWFWIFTSTFAIPLLQIVIARRPPIGDAKNITMISIYFVESISVILLAILVRRRS